MDGAGKAVLAQDVGFGNTDGQGGLPLKKMSWDVKSEYRNKMEREGEQMGDSE